MDLQTMRTEVQARGFSHVTSSYIDRWINLTYHDVNSRWPWPYLEQVTSASGNVTLTDLAHILSVVDTTNKVPLEWRDIRILRQYDPALALTGTPRFWYRDGTGGTTVIKTYPVTSNTTDVRYIRIAPDLGTDVSVPLAPANFHYLFVEGACARAYKRAAEEPSAQASFGELEVGIKKMADLLLPPGYDQPIPGKPDAENSPEDVVAEAGQ